MFVTNRAVLRRPDVRTRTSTTPVGMGLGGIRNVGAWKNGFSLLNGVASGGGFGTYQGAWEGDRKGDAQQASPFLHIEFRMTFGTNYQRLYWFFFSSRSSAGISGASGS